MRSVGKNSTRTGKSFKVTDFSRWIQVLWILITMKRGAKGVEQRQTEFREQRPVSQLDDLLVPVSTDCTQKVPTAATSSIQGAFFKSYQPRRHVCFSGDDKTCRVRLTGWEDPFQLHANTQSLVQACKTMDRLSDVSYIYHRSKTLFASRWFRIRPEASNVLYKNKDLFCCGDGFLRTPVFSTSLK